MRERLKPGGVTRSLPADAAAFDRAIEPASSLSSLEPIKRDGDFQRRRAALSINISLVWLADGGSII
jgi:hypothetical protein